MTDDELRQLVASNARAIQALGDQISELTNDLQRLSVESHAERAELRQATIGIANLLASLDSDRPTILRKLTTIENKVDQILEQQLEQRSETGTAE